MQEMKEMVGIAGEMRCKKIMEDKRKEELKEKAESVSAWLEEIRLCNEGITEASKAFDNIYFNWPCDILVKPIDEKALKFL